MSATIPNLGRTTSRVAATVIGVAGLVIACGGQVARAPSSLSYTHSPTQDIAATKVDTLSASMLDASQFPIFMELLDASYDRAFAAVVQVLKSRGEPISQADSDKGYIATSRVQHGLIISHHDQFVVALQPVSSTNTRMAFKLFHWADMDTDNPAVVHLAPETDEIVAGVAAQFIAAVHAALR